MFLTKDTTIPGLTEARQVQAEIKRLGIQDVELFYDAEIKTWCVVQIRKANSGILTMQNLANSGAEPYLLFYCKNDVGAYRPPNKNDVSDVVRTVRRAEQWFKPGGGDKLADELDAQDTARTATKEAMIKERWAPHMRPLKKAIREELG